MTEYWVEFPVLYTSFLLVIYFLYVYICVYVYPSLPIYPSCPGEFFLTTVSLSSPTRKMGTVTPDLPESSRLKEVVV